MHLFTRIRRIYITLPPVKWLIRWSKRVIIPGFHGIPLFDVLTFIRAELKKEGLMERASSIAFNLLMAIPPAIIFLFTLIPYLPIRAQFINEMYSLVRDIVPGKDNEPIINFLSDFINNPRHGLLSFGLLLALFYSSNAMTGIMKSFDKNYIDFKKRSSFGKLKVSLRLTLWVFLLVLLCIGLLVAQGAVLKWLGVEDPGVREIIHNARWLVIIALFFSINSFIYRHAPSVYKKWGFFTPGTIVSTTLMLVTTLLFSIYVNNFNSYNTLYGTLGTLIILMLLLYVNSLVLLIGFELNVSIKSLKRIAEERKEQMAKAAAIKEQQAATS